MSKFEYEKIKRRFYYSFFEHDNNNTETDLSNLDYLWLHFHKRLIKSSPRYDIDEYLNNISDMIPDGEKVKNFI